ncbi:protein PHYLLO, chloroplastic isoform X2 [Nymphaea colorata]|uniref:protein PHYLLO, chloroplastic isoform X2 n=1 Tax=Nymphaea colorata TaxID=210225 RepID=UPI00129EED36|nr:protein PHYLLO, chloroplastic isoform X2 [Nymphaea colorata]
MNFQPMVLRNPFFLLSCHLTRWWNQSHDNLDVEDESSAKLVILSANSCFGTVDCNDVLVLDVSQGCHRFYFRLSAMTAFTRNMDNAPVPFTGTLESCLNINSLWATLIVEECCRLGLTYFCIAPGSRSSPLAVAAASHPNATCISCFDERSLAFHAVGYARGSCGPAVVITSSGTAVSNLLPAVVEASEDFVPLLLLTADRPPELQDVGANQAINQVNHFGSFVRYFFSLPPPDDHIPAKIVLTTIDSAVHHATISPCGPVHINCPFREPLHNGYERWDASCLVGTNLWTSKVKPFTKYISIAHASVFSYEGDISEQLKEVLNLINGAAQGLLVLGGIHSEDDIWAVLLLAQHLRWPVAPDILSGLRQRKVMTSLLDSEKKFMFIDHLDHALLSESVRAYIKPDVVVQIGSRLTSKRIARMLEMCSPQSYIMVEKHPHRHDPSHIVTHRIQCSIVEFASVILKFVQPSTRSNWCTWLQALNAMVAWEISFRLHAEESLSEPFVAQVVSEALYPDAAMFLGNSMIIRDFDNYAHTWMQSDERGAYKFTKLGVPSIGVRVAGNRGASGIDGLLSTAIGFAVGSKKRVLVVIGDMSFLHDTNGLAILNQRMLRKPVTIVVINNRGGAIFRLLPIADRTPASIMERYFYTSHDVKVAELCMAHGVKHLQVQTKKELQDALALSHQSLSDCVIEVNSFIEKNATFHSDLQKFAQQAAESTLATLLKISGVSYSNIDSPCRIMKMQYSLYRILLSAPTTATKVNDRTERCYREGFVLTLYLQNGNMGIGEVAPMEIHSEDLVDVEEQLRFLCHRIQGVELSPLLPLFRGSFALWMWRTIGIQPSTIFPSVRCGLEMAVLNALAAVKNSSMLDLILGGESLHIYRMDTAGKCISNATRVQTCALVDSDGSAEDIIDRVSQLVKDGFSTVKLKVARRASPSEDAAIIQAIRNRLGYQINIRVDANRMWTFEEAIEFGKCIASDSLQYIEEPVQNEEDIVRFCEETSLPVALDETIDNFKGDIYKLTKFLHPGIVAFVIKPSYIGGFENSSLIAEWAEQHGKMAVISGAFESSISLSAYVQFAFYIDWKRMEYHKMRDMGPAPAVAHGLGTYQWLQEDVIIKPLKFALHPHGNSVEASVEDAKHVFHNFQINHDRVRRSYAQGKINSYSLTAKVKDLLYSLQVLDTGKREDDGEAIVFLHGFLGTSEDWTPMMEAISATRRCISFDLPGHGKSQPMENNLEKILARKSNSFEQFMKEIIKVINCITPGKVVLVGYSMGARMALYTALRHSEKVAKAVIISGSPGLKDLKMRKYRAAHDEAKASYLAKHGLEHFLKSWYARDLWDSFCCHPLFDQITQSRAKHADVNALSASLSDFSTGKQPSLWEDLRHCRVPLLFIVGEKDAKFRKITEQMYADVTRKVNTSRDHPVSTATYNEECEQVRELHRVLVVPDCGHAVHLESPLPVINAIRRFSNGSDLMT